MRAWPIMTVTMPSTQHCGSPRQVHDFPTSAACGTIALLHMIPGRPVRLVAAFGAARPNRFLESHVPPRSPAADRWRDSRRTQAQQHDRHRLPPRLDTDRADSQAFLMDRIT